MQSGRITMAPNDARNGMILSIAGSAAISRSLCSAIRAGVSRSRPRVPRAALDVRREPAEPSKCRNLDRRRLSLEWLRLSDRILRGISDMLCQGIRKNCAIGIPVRTRRNSVQGQRGKFEPAAGSSAFR